MSTHITKEEALEAIASLKDTEQHSKKQKQKALKSQLLTYIALILFLAIINIISNPEHLWFIYPALGRGFAIVIQYIRLKTDE